MKDYEQIISTLLAKIAELEEIVKQQAARIAELARRLNKNSSNSLTKAARKRLCTQNHTFLF